MLQPRFHGRFQHKITFPFHIYYFHTCAQAPVFNFPDPTPPILTPRLPLIKRARAARSSLVINVNVSDSLVPRPHPKKGWVLGWGLGTRLRPHACPGSCLGRTLALVLVDPHVPYWKKSLVGNVHTLRTTLLQCNTMIMSLYSFIVNSELSLLIWVDTS